MIFIQGPSNAEVAVIGDQPLAEEAHLGRAFATWKSKVLKECMHKAGTSELQCYTGYIAPAPHPSGNFDNFYDDPKTLLYPNPQLKEYLELFRVWFEKHKPKVIITIGKHATRIVTGQPVLDDVRGYVIYSNISPLHTCKVVPTFTSERLAFERHHSFTVTMDFKKALAVSNTPLEEKTNKVLIPDARPDEFIEYCDWIVESIESDAFPEDKYLDSEQVLEGVALDIENTIGNGCHITQFGVGHSGNFAMTMNFLKGKSPALSEYDELRVWQAIARLSKCKANFIAHNAVHDLAVTWMNNHILFKIGFDTMLAGQLLYPELLKSLKFLCSLCLNVAPWKHISGEDTYNPEDVANTKKLFDVLKKRIDGRDLEKIRAFETRQLPVASMFQLQGVKIDQKRQQLLIRRYSKYLTKLKLLLDKKCIEAMGEVINYNSPKQVGELLYGALKLPKQFKRRKSVKDKQSTTTDQDALVTLCQKTDSMIPRLMIKYKKATKAVSSYLDISISPEGTVHTSYNIGSAVERFKVKKAGAEDNKSLGRWSSSESIILPYGPGNLQSVPEYARSMYVPFEDGWEIACGDFVQAEAVIVAYLSDDEPLIRIIERGKALREALRHETDEADLVVIKKKLKQVDIHRIKAMELFDIPAEKISGEQRQVGKLTRHSTNYDSGPKVLQTKAAGIEIYKDLKYWKDLMERDRKKAPAKYNWHGAIVQELSDNNRVLSNPYFRHRRFMAEWNVDLWKRGYAFKPQSTIGDLLNDAMMNFYDQWCDKIRLLLQLHDGMYISYPANERMLWLRRLREAMTIPMEINGREVIIDVEIKAGPNWKDLKEVNV